MTSSKIASGLILALAVVACTAQESDVATAYQLYKGCYRGALQAHNNISPITATEQQIVDVIENTDEFCTAWTYAWYPAITNTNGLTPFESLRFNAKRHMLLG